MKVTRHEEFETAHLLPGYNGGCGNLHGHSYKIEVTLEGPQDSDFDMVVDFKILKQIIKNTVPDHKFVYYEKDEIGKQIAEVLDKHDLKYDVYPFHTTAENMVKYFASEIDKTVKTVFPKVDVVEVKLWETTNSYATWTR